MLNIYGLFLQSCDFYKITFLFTKIPSNFKSLFRHNAPISFDSDWVNTIKFQCTLLIAKGYPHKYSLRPFFHNSISIFSCFVPILPFNISQTFSLTLISFLQPMSIVQFNMKTHIREYFNFEFCNCKDLCQDDVNALSSPSI
jgi:hypothetical protein